MGWSEKICFIKIVYGFSLLVLLLLGWHKQNNDLFFNWFRVVAHCYGLCLTLIQCTKVQNNAQTVMFSLTTSPDQFSLLGGLVPSSPSLSSPSKCFVWLCCLLIYFESVTSCSHWCCHQCNHNHLVNFSPPPPPPQSQHPFLPEEPFQLLVTACF